MKNYRMEILFAILLGMVAPWLIVGFYEACNGFDSYETVANTIPPTIQSDVTVEEEMYISVLIDGQVVQLPINDYVAGVLLCELPESFAMEAKKAQAVVARTYALRTCGFTDKHAGECICANPDCCQGYIAPADYEGTQNGIDAAVKAAYDTSGEVLTFGGELIEATYFSCSGGQTEDAIAVWGSDIPYLRSVDSPGEERATYYTNTVTIAIDDFRDALSLTHEPEADGLIGKITYTNGGGVSQIEIANKNFTGTQVRYALGLRSTAFVISVVGGNVIITTRGFGHRVGMSQYGAEAMALAGKKYEEILAHYYRGTTLIKQG